MECFRYKVKIPSETAWVRPFTLSTHFDDPNWPFLWFNLIGSRSSTSLASAIFDKIKILIFLSEIESRQIKTDLQRLITRAQRWNQMISMRKVIWPKDDPELYAVLIKLLKDAYSTRAPYSAVFQVNTDYSILKLNDIYHQHLAITI